MPSLVGHARAVEAPRPIPNCYWVIPGRFLASEYPGARDEPEARDKLGRLLDAGVTDFVDLCEPGELAPYAALLREEAARRGRVVRTLRVALRDRDIPPTPGALVPALDAVDAALTAGRVVCLHCRGGIGRTGLAVGCWLVRHGATGREALARIAGWWTIMEKRDRMPVSPETPAQRAYVRAWQEPARP